MGTPVPSGGRGVLGEYTWSRNNWRDTPFWLVDDIHLIYFLRVPYES